MNRIVFLKGQSQYDALRHHIDCMALSARELGYQADVYDLLNPDHWDNLPTLLADTDGFVVSFIGLNTRFEGKSIAELADAPHVVMLVDHPAHQFDRLKTATPRNIVTVLDHHHQTWISEFLPDFPARLAMLPPGGSVAEPHAIEEACETFARNRDIPVLFTGTYYDFNSALWRDSPDSPLARIMDRAAEIALEGEEVSLHVAVRQAIGQLFGDAVIGSVYPKIGSVMGALNSVVHGQRRWNSLLQLAKAKVPVHLYGNGWDRHLYRLKSFTYGGTGSAPETRDLLKHTRICLNSNTNFVSGAHERVFMAQMLGAAVVSDTSAWYRENYTDGEDIALFNWTSAPSVVDRIQTLLDSPRLLHSIAEAGYRKANAWHSWRNRIEALVDLATAHKAA